MPGFAIGPYLEPYGSTLRPIAHYATWTAYYASFALQPGLITLLQALVLLLTWFLPPLERWTERSRDRMRSSDWASERWAWAHTGGRRPDTEYPEWLKATGRAVDIRWMFVAAWEWCVAQMRTLSARMGWGKAAPAFATKGKKKDAAAPRARPPAIELRALRTPPTPAPQPAPTPPPPSHHSHQSSPFLPLSPLSHHSHHSLPTSPASPASNAPTARSNPFSDVRPPTLRSRSAAFASHAGPASALGSARLAIGRSMSVTPDAVAASGWGGGAASLHSNGTSPFSAAARSQFGVQGADGASARGSVWTGRASGWRPA